MDEFPLIKCPRLKMFVDRSRCLNCDYHVKVGRDHYCSFVDPYSDYIKLWREYMHLGLKLKYLETKQSGTQHMVLILQAGV